MCFESVATMSISISFLGATLLRPKRSQQPVHRDGLNLRTHPAERAEVGQHFLRLELLPAAEELLGDVFRPNPAILITSLRGGGVCNKRKTILRLLYGPGCCGPI